MTCMNNGETTLGTRKGHNHRVIPAQVWMNAAEAFESAQYSRIWNGKHLRFLKRVSCSDTGDRHASWTRFQGDSQEPNEDSQEKNGMMVLPQTDVATESDLLVSLFI